MEDKKQNMEPVEASNTQPTKKDVENSVKDTDPSLLDSPDSKPNISTVEKTQTTDDYGDTATTGSGAKKVEARSTKSGADEVAKTKKAKTLSPEDRENFVAVYGSYLPSLDNEASSLALAFRRVASDPNATQQDMESFVKQLEVRVEALQRQQILLKTQEGVENLGAFAGATDPNSQAIALLGKTDEKGSGAGQGGLFATPPVDEEDYNARMAIIAAASSMAGMLAGAVGGDFAGGASAGTAGASAVADIANERRKQLSESKAEYEKLAWKQAQAQAQIQSKEFISAQKIENDKAKAAAKLYQKAVIHQDVMAAKEALLALKNEEFELSRDTQINSYRKSKRLADIADEKNRLRAELAWLNAQVKEFAVVEGSKKPGIFEVLSVINGNRNSARSRGGSNQPVGGSNLVETRMLALDDWKKRFGLTDGNIAQALSDPNVRGVGNAASHMMNKLFVTTEKTNIEKANIAGDVHAAFNALYEFQVSQFGKDNALLIRPTNVWLQLSDAQKIGKLRSMRGRFQTLSPSTSGYFVEGEGAKYFQVARIDGSVKSKQALMLTLAQQFSSASTSAEKNMYVFKGRADAKRDKVEQQQQKQDDEVLKVNWYSKNSEGKSKFDKNKYLSAATQYLLLNSDKARGVFLNKAASDLKAKEDKPTFFNNIIDSIERAGGNPLDDEVLMKYQSKFKAE